MKKLLITLFLTSVALPGMIAVAQTLDTTGTAVLESQTTANTNLSRTAITQIQQSLHSGGYYTGAIDGVWNDSMNTAVTRYQTANRLNATGRLDDATLGSLGVSSALGGGIGVNNTLGAAGRVLNDTQPLNNSNSARTQSSVGASGSVHGTGTLGDTEPMDSSVRVDGGVNTSGGARLDNNTDNSRVGGAADSSVSGSVTTGIGKNR